MKYILVALLALFAFSLAQAQEVAQADIRITSFQTTTSGTKIHLVVDVKSDWDDDAANARLVFLLPVGVRVIGSTLPRDAVPGASCHAVGLTGTPSYHSQVRCYLGNLATSGPNSERHIEFDVRIVLAFTNKSFGAFVSSDSPDPSAANNFATATP